MRPCRAGVSASGAPNRADDANSCRALLNAPPGPILLAAMSLTLRTSPESPPGEEFGFLDLATVLLRHRRRLVLWPLYEPSWPRRLRCCCPVPSCRRRLPTVQQPEHLDPLGDRGAVWRRSAERRRGPVSGLLRRLGKDSDHSPGRGRIGISLEHIGRRGPGRPGQAARYRRRRPAQAGRGRHDRLADMVSVSSDAQTAIVKVSVSAKQPISRSNRAATPRSGQ